MDFLSVNPEMKVALLEYVMLYLSNFVKRNKYINKNISKALQHKHKLIFIFDRELENTKTYCVKLKINRKSWVEPSIHKEK